MSWSGSTVPVSRRIVSMDDTTEEVRRYVRERYARLTGAERLLIGAQMFETARAFAVASMPVTGTERERRRRLCERLYGAEIAARAYP
jgi:hypothetical protein